MDLKLPCVKCIILGICKGLEPKGIHISTFLNSYLLKRCSIIKYYLELKDLGIDITKCDFSSPISERKYIYQPQSKRILELYKFMNWEDGGSLDQCRIFARGEVPK